MDRKYLEKLVQLEPLQNANEFYRKNSFSKCDFQGIKESSKNLASKTAMQLMTRIFAKKTTPKVKLSRLNLLQNEVDENDLQLNKGNHNANVNAIGRVLMRDRDRKKKQHNYLIGSKSKRTSCNRNSTIRNRNQMPFRNFKVSVRHISLLTVLTIFLYHVRLS